jgi:hypothetical protein
MKTLIEDAPRLIECLLDSAEDCKAEWERWMMRLDSEANPDAQRRFEEIAASEMQVHNALMSDADVLIQQITAAGNDWKRNP